METKHPRDSNLPQPVQLRLYSLFERIAYLDRTLAEIPSALPNDLQRHLELTALYSGLKGIQRAFEGIVTTMCLVLDRSVPDDDKDWYEAALRQLAGTGSGRARVLPADLTYLLREEVGIYPDSDPTLALEENLTVQRQRQRQKAAMLATPMLVDALTALDAKLADEMLRDGQMPDPEFIAQHAIRQERAEAQRQALTRAFFSVEKAFHEKGYQAIPFGSFVEGRVHGRSDLDLVVPGDISHEAQRELWDVAEDIARSAGIECDLHFPCLYTDDFLDRLKVILDDQIAPLRNLVAAATEMR